MKEEYFYNAYKDKLENPEDWVERPDLKIFLKRMRLPASLQM